MDRIFQKRLNNTMYNTETNGKCVTCSMMDNNSRKRREEFLT